MSLCTHPTSLISLRQDFSGHVGCQKPALCYRANGKALGKATGKPAALEPWTQIFHKRFPGVRSCLGGSWGRAAPSTLVFTRNVLVCPCQNIPGDGARRSHPWRLEAAVAQGDRRSGSAPEVVLLWRSLAAVTELEKKPQSTNGLLQLSPLGSRVPACGARNGQERK